MHRLERRRGCRPTVEGLESRRLLAAMSLFSLPTGTHPDDMVDGPDGNLWFVDEGIGIGMFNPTTQSTTIFPTEGGGGSFRGVAVGPDGNIWFTDWRANEVGTINVTTDVMTEFPLPTPDAGVDGITAGPDGNLWFLQSGTSQIGSINATTHAITEYSLPSSDLIGFGPEEEDLTMGPDGNLWLAATGLAGEPYGAVEMFNLTTHELTDFPLPDDYGPTGITIGPDGNLWFAANTAIGTINTTTDAITMFPLPPSPGSGWEGLYDIPDPIGITTGPDGNIWFANWAGNSIGMIDPTTHAITEFPIPNDVPDQCCGPAPFDIVAGSNDAVWFDLAASDQMGEINLSPPNSGSTGPAGGFSPASPPAAASPPTTASPLTADDPPAPGFPFSFTIDLIGGSMPAAAQHDDTITLALGNKPASGGDGLSFTTRNGVTSVSGLTLRRFDHGAGYRIATGERARVAMPNASWKIALPRLLATEKILTAGKGKNRHDVGIRVVLAKAFEPALARDMTNRTASVASGRRSGSAGLQVSYQTSVGIDNLVLYGKAKVASTGQIVVVAKTQSG